jgi:hypothetical protein
MTSLGHPPGTEPDLLVPRLDLTVGSPDPVAIATWHMAVSDLVGNEIPHQLFGLWVFPEHGGAVLLGPDGLAEDRLDLPEPDPVLTQDQLFELEEKLRRAKYASAVALPVHGTERDVGLSLIGGLDPGLYGPSQVRRLQQLAAELRNTLEPLSRLIRGRPAGQDSAITPRVAGEDLPEVITRAVSEVPSGPELVRRLSGLLHAHLPHDRLEVLSFANGAAAVLPLSGAATRRRWGGPGGQTWGDMVRMLEDALGTAPTAAIADLAQEAPGLGWPGASGADGPVRVASVLVARLELAEQPIGLLVAGHAAADLYRPQDEELVEQVARLIGARVAALQFESEALALRGQLEVLQAPSLPVLRAADALASTSHLGEALHRFGVEVGEVVPHDRIRFLLRWSETEVVTLAPEAIRPLPDLPLTPIGALPARLVLDGDRAWLASQSEEGMELAVALRVADRRIGVMVLEARSFQSPREAAASAQQFAAVVAPHLELVRRSALAGAVRPSRSGAESVRRPGG